MIKSHDIILIGDSMKLKKKVIILCIVGLILLIGAFIADKIISKNYFASISSNEIISKMDNKESFVLCISQTTCNHCQSYKPKLEKVANKYKVNIYYIDVDLLNEEEKKELNKYISISGGTPSTVFIKEGSEKTAASRINGDVSTTKIVQKLEQHNFIK